ncbi:MAG: hypothetical protein J6C11_03785 [Spirochaetaceae bacterium]|nr:hypothetical protein [Spirochaetaceae bacterium]MBP3673513.1 hypothetical protein [Oscillospiraceae bacterium]
MPRIRRWQLCRTGKHGQDGATITRQDLQDLVDTFVPTRPISIGHDMARGDSWPKFGDVLALEGIRDDPAHPGEQVLVGSVMLHPELDSIYDDGDGNGLYRGWSVTIPRRASDGKRYLHSLAITGAVPPKIPGLEQLMTKNCYAEDDAIEIFSFGDNPKFQEVSMTEEEKKMEELEAERDRLKKELEELKAKGGKDAKPKVPPTEDDPRQKGEYNDAASKAMIAKLEEMEAELRQAKVERFCDAIRDRVPAGILDKARALAAGLAEGKEVNFSDNTSADALLTLQEILSLWPTMEGQQLYSFSDDGDSKDKNSKNEGWSKVASRL